MVVLEALSGKVIESVVEKVKEVIDEGKKKIQAVRIVHAPNSFYLIDVRRATTTKQNQQTNPDIEFENPRNETDVLLKEISLVPNVNFRAKGIVLITANDVPIYKGETSGFMTDIEDDENLIPNGKILKGGESIKVYFWNGVDATTIALTVKVNFSDVE